jgi:hypothetical protein
VHAADLIPVGIGAINAEQALGRIAPEQVTGDGAKEAAVEARGRAVDLRAELAAERR